MLPDSQVCETRFGLGCVEFQKTVFSVFVSLLAPSAAVTYPLDVLRRRMQMRGAMGEKFPYRNTPHAISTIFKTEGVLGFYKGMLPNILKVAPSIAIAFVTYEFMKARLFGVPIAWR